MPSTISQSPSDKLPAPADAARIVAAAFTKGDANAALVDLHAFELLVADNAEWPWMRWKHLSVDNPGYMDALPKAVPSTITDTGLAHTILAVALDVRRGDTTDSGSDMRDALFAKDSGLMAASKTLGPSLQLELALIAFHERRWRAVELLAVQLLSLACITGNAALDARIDDLLLDTLFFAIYRPYMPKYVSEPKPLVDKLATLPQMHPVSRILARGGIAALNYRANMLALKGDFAAALPLYAEAADKSGFRSPVFQQTQVLLPVADLDVDSRAADMASYHARSKTSFAFTHPAASEHALLVAVEPGYFDLYGELYARIVGTTNPGALIHFHLINFPDDRAGVTARLRALETLAGVRINHTFEDNQYMADRPQLKGGVCVNTRYIYLPEYLDAYAGVTITDIDGWLLKSIHDLSDFGAHDSLVSSWIWRQNTGYWRLPWGNLSGGFCSIRSTDKSKQFAALVAHYLTRLFERNAYAGKPLFYADQAAHFLCLQYAHTHWGMKMGFIGGGFAQSEELPFQVRNEGKRQAMQNMLDKLQKTSRTGP